MNALLDRYQLQDRDIIIGEAETPYVIRVKDLDDDDKPREKLINSGPQSLDIAELVSVLWGVGTKKEDVLAMARRTLQEYGEKAILSEHDPHRLAQAAEIPLIKACQIIAAFEIGKRYYAVGRSGRSIQVRTANQAFEYLRDMAELGKEQLRGLYLNSRYQIVYDEVISVGSLTSNVVHPREVFQPAIERGAVAIIVAHNHPSGVLEPTNADIAVTEQLMAAGDVLGIELLDHLIIAGGKYLSIRECLPE